MLLGVRTYFKLAVGLGLPPSPQLRQGYGGHAMLRTGAANQDTLAGALMPVCARRCGTWTRTKILCSRGRCPTIRRSRSAAHKHRHFPSEPDKKQSSLLFIPTIRRSGSIYPIALKRTDFSTVRLVHHSTHSHQDRLCSQHSSGKIEVSEGV